MKKAAPLKEKNKEKKLETEELREKDTPRVLEEQKEEDVVIPPDILEETHSEESDSSVNEEKSEETEENSSEPSFYERVTGESPERHTFVEDPSEPDSQIENVNRKLFFLGGFVFLLTVVVATLVGFYILNNSKQHELVKTNEVQEEAEAKPTPTVVAINKEEWTFEVLNGSGIKGAAAEAQDKIEALGYTVESIGNASELESTQVYISDESDKNDVEKILPDLKKDFGDLTIEDKVRKSEAKIVIILGSKSP